KDDPNYVNVDIDIAVKLKQENKAFNVQKFVHNYPHCWRTDKPVLYYPLDSWFIKTTAMKDRMVELNKTINWKPASTGQGRFTNWLENLQDWNLSRSRFWGIPLPVWRTKEADDELCIGSVEELKKKTEQANKALNLQQSVPTDLHRPYIDEVVLYSEKTGKPMYRELDLIDVWFDSGSMPYAQWHYPFENVEKFKANFPADFIAEGVDQTRGWFFTLHAIATMAFDSIAFKNVVSNGLVQDKFGRKMSKRLGNTVEPFETIAKYGADATRWYMISNAQPWDNLKFDIEGIDEVRRKFFGTMYNTYSFFALYANIDGFKYSEARVPVSKRPEIDRWIISKLNSLIVEVFDFYADYEPTNAARAIQDFVDSHLSNWYVRLCRRRFWKGEYTEDKITAYQTLYECMNTIAKLMAPVAPFFADWLYLNLNTVTESENYESVHLATFPEEESSAIDPTLEERMDYAQRISSLILSIRKKEKIRVRQPLLKALLPVLDDRFQKQVEAVQDLIMAEVNVKSFEFVTNTAGVISKTIKANFKTLGKRLGKDMKAAADMISQFDQETIRQIEQQKYYVLNIGDTSYTLEQEDFEIGFNDIPGWQVASDRDLTVALDITLNDDLIAEGTARDLINRIQNIRKTSDLNVTDRIIIKLESNDAVNVAIDKFADYICSETLADSLTTEKEVNGERLELFEDVIIGIEVLPVLSVK
ncbi:MAG TPA: class I tRNA ligase family protein, partial [Saprospiraceae bacterium]|nr:class I tRNA ligase family protein [Saprospiraceae bacterium]